MYSSMVSLQQKFLGKEVWTYDYCTNIFIRSKNPLKFDDLKEFIGAAIHLTFISQKKHGPKQHLMDVGKNLLMTRLLQEKKFL